MPESTYKRVSFPSRGRWLRRTHFCLSVLFLVNSTFSLVLTEPSSLSSSPYFSSLDTHINEPSLIKSRLFRRGLWTPPEGATPYEPQPVSQRHQNQQIQKAPQSPAYLTPAPPNVGGFPPLGLTSKAKTSGKNGTLGSIPNPNIVSVPLQDLMADTVVSTKKFYTVILVIYEFDSLIKAAFGLRM